MGARTQPECRQGMGKTTCLPPSPLVATSSQPCSIPFNHQLLTNCPVSYLHLACQEQCYEGQINSSQSAAFATLSSVWRKTLGHLLVQDSPASEPTGLQPHQQLCYWVWLSLTVPVSMPVWSRLLATSVVQQTERPAISVNFL